MKYIRTKDRIWLSENIEYDESGHAYSKITDFYQDFTKEDIIDQADTIEELCDEFRYEFRYSKHKRCFALFNKKIWLDWETDTELSIKEIATIKGAIWTDKGLIYVAKMNEKGELELL